MATALSPGDKVVLTTFGTQGDLFPMLALALQLRARGLRPRMFAMDATPAMLQALGAKPGLRAVPFLGVLDDIEGSVRAAREAQPMPELFEGAFSTLALHHCAEPANFFEGAARVLQHGAPLVVVDLVEHDRAGFKEEMGDVHLGFRPGYVEAIALERFHRAEARVLAGARCDEGCGSGIGLFAATLQR